MISIFAKSEKKKKNDEGLIMTTEEEEIKRRKKEKKENKRRNQNKVCRKSGLGEIVLKQFSLLLQYLTRYVWNMIFYGIH